MKTIKQFLLIIFVAQTTIAQIIPSTQRVDWSNAGYRGVIPQPANIVDVANFGATGNGITNDYPAVLSAIQSLSGQQGVVYFPSGIYKLSSTINVPDSIIIRGAGADSTTLLFDFNNAVANCINISNGQATAFDTLTSGYTKDSYALILNNASQYSIGDYVEVRQNNGTWDTNPVYWADNSVGHIAKVIAVSNDTVFIDEALRLDFDVALFPVIRKINLRKECGLECFKLMRADTAAPSVNFGVYFYGATNCWIRGVESVKSIGAHFWAELSSHITISGCYIHECIEYTGSNTRGYGIGFAVHACANLVEDNILRHLRHAMMVKQGANGNVFSYNYSFEPTRSEFPTNYGGDISLHGHYPFANLFEGNIAQNCMIDQSWGPSGPFNTFFRNRIELYGIVMSSGTVQSNGQNFVGNDVPNTGLFMGLYNLTGSNHVQHGNRVKGNITPAGTGTLNDTSYYLTQQPLFWNISNSYPSIGIPNSQTGQSIPARERYLAGAFTLCGFPVITLPPPPTSLFSSTDSTFCANNCISFIDNSIDTPTTWQWFFSGAFPDTSTLQHPANICYNTNGSYDVMLITCNAGGCDTLLLHDYITVYSNPNAPVISLSNDTLFCSPAFAYQWYLNNNAISGGTDSIYVFTQNGNYSVMVTDTNGCTSQSSNSINTGIQSFENGNCVLFQNPVKDKLEIEFESEFNSMNCRIEIFDFGGKNLFRKNYLSLKDKISIDVSGLKNGNYLITIFTEKEIFRRQFMVLH